MFRFILLNFIVLNSNQFACEVDDRIMYSIAEIEKHQKRIVGYPYLISFNDKQDLSKLNDSIKSFFIDNRTIDCLNIQVCNKLLNLFIMNGIKNLDCGAFQLNYMYWKLPIGEYFDIKKSYLKACSIIENNNKLKWSWSNIANYHSSTPKINKKYQALLLASIKKNIKN